ncbi:MAG: PilZ domain-containing protein, partial [Candidatus Angelobacter sp.]
FGVSVSISFALPGTKIQADITGKVAWTNKEGHQGIQFNEMSAPHRTSLQRWLRAEMRKDGWELSAE